MNTDHNCIFCRIITGEIPAEIIYRDDYATAFKDARPIAPVHVLIVPNSHFSSLLDTNVGDEQTLGHLFLVAQQIAKDLHVENNGFRLVLNTGADAGQSVFHIHIHLLAGRRLSFGCQ
jgi:histidine triad (HIT) family protein